MRPGTPEVTLLATRHIKNKPTTQQDRPKDRIHIEYSEVDNAILLGGLQMGQVVTNVFTGRWAMLHSVFFSSHQLLLSVTFAVKRFV